MIKIKKLNLKVTGEHESIYTFTFKKKHGKFSYKFYEMFIFMTNDKKLLLHETYCTDREEFSEIIFEEDVSLSEFMSFLRINSFKYVPMIMGFLNLDDTDWVSMDWEIKKLDNFIGEVDEDEEVSCW